MFMGVIMEGKVFNQLTVLKLSHCDVNYNKHWVCVCRCGGQTVVRGDQLTRSKKSTASCGCLRRKGTMEAARAVREKNIVGYGNRAYLRDSYRSMLRRCYEPKHPGYSKYGGKGIEVCARWRFGETGKTGLDCFCEDMGIRPKGLTIDRIDGDKGYYPDNCRWATRQEQAKNKNI